jgi:NAD/NADP transhydrogenase alpha subunit
MTVAVAVPDTKVRDAVTRVLPIVMVQADVFREADSVTSVRTELAVTPDRTSAVAVDETLMPAAVEPMKTAVAVSNGTSIRYHAVPSLAMAQVLDVLVAVTPAIAANRFVALTVFGVLVWFLNVTVLSSFFAHDPV